MAQGFPLRAQPGSALPQEAGARWGHLPESPAGHSPYCIIGRNCSPRTFAPQYGAHKQNLPRIYRFQVVFKPVDHRQSRTKSKSSETSNLGAPPRDFKPDIFRSRVIRKLIRHLSPASIDIEISYPSSRTANSFNLSTSLRHPQTYGFCNQFLVFPVLVRRCG